MAIKLDEARIRRLSTNGVTTIAGGHIYLTGSQAGSSTGNTTQIVFGTSSSNHVALSSNDKALVINPTTSSTTNQIVLYLNQKSKFPSGIDAGTGGITTTGAISASGNISGNYIQGTWLYTSAATAQTTTSKIAVIHSDNYIYYITPANLTTLIKDNASGTWAISISGNAATASSVAWGNVTGKPSTFTPSSHTHSYIASKGNYTFDSSTLPNSFDLGLSCGFVNSNSGFGSYGGVITHRAYSGGGGSLQLYSPYSSNYGGTHLKARFGNYSVSSGNSWTDLKEIAWVSDIPTKISQLTNDASGTWSISISGNAATTTAFSSAASISLNGDVTGSASSTKGWSITTTANKISYPAQLTTDDTINNFNAANKFQVATWNSTSSPGVSNGIIMSGGWTSTSYGWQIAIDDDPTWYIALRQRDGNGWKAWKRIPMGDGTGASGDWSINITGSSASCTGNAATASKVNNVIPEWSGSIAWADTSWIAAWNGDGTKIKALAKSSFAAAGHTHSYAGSSSAGGAAHSANKLNINNTAGLADCLQYIQTSSQTAGNDLPSAAWHHVIKMNHGNGDTYYKRLLAFDFWGQNNVYTTTAEGNGTVKAWKKFWIEGDSVTGAVWNDYAEYRESDCKEFGRVLAEKGDDTLTKTTKRLQPFAGVSSDTWGFCQGETEKAKTPIAVAGRVLVYTYRNRKEYKPGDAVCAAPNGTVDIMTREEIIKYPDRIVGTVSCVPEYETWGSGDRDPVKVGNRIWIKVN